MFLKLLDISIDFFTYRGSTGRGLRNKPVPIPIPANLLTSPDWAPAAITQMEKSIVLMSPSANRTWAESSHDPKF